MHPVEKDIDRQYQNDQTAINHVDHLCNTPKQSPTSFHDGIPACQMSHLSAVDKDIHAQFERAKAQYKYKRGEEVASRFRSAFEAGEIALWELSSHIAKSLPNHLKSSRSILHKTWFLMHYKVAGLAFHQAGRSARRLGLKHVADRSSFLLEHCGWYPVFCRYSRLIFPVKG